MPDLLLILTPNEIAQLRADKEVIATEMRYGPYRRIRIMSEAAYKVLDSQFCAERPACGDTSR